MNKIFLLAVLFWGCLPVGAFAQTEVIADKAYVLDTLRSDSHSSSLGLLFYVSDGEMDDASFRLAASAHFTYVFRRHDIELSFRQIADCDGGVWDNNSLLLLSGGMMKYRPIDGGRTVLRRLYVEPVFIYQNNSDRGLRRRFQLGALVHPWGYYRPKFNIYFGIGAVYDWSSWEVNDAAEIAAADPALREKIEFVNARIRMRKGMYQDHSEWRPMLLLTVNYKANNTISLKLNTSFQQSLRSPYSKEIREKYPYMGRVYPYVLTHLDLTFKVYKGLALNISASVDYENSNLSLYKSSWGYNTLIGFTWTFSNHSAR
ncbi:hypothetical protein LJC45_01985 [Alistipes sp. OttesenSCG-928-B03]|nr:hypothetical protein [Alistipes sp. OttesenSCG-928-B03]